MSTRSRLIPAIPAIPAGDRPDAARRAVGWVFALNGFAMASWISRLPAVRDALHLSPGRLGLVLLAMSAGSLGALPLSGTVVHRIGPARAVAFSGSVCMAGLAGAGLAGAVAGLAVALFAVGVGMGLWDVAMNVEGALVEQAIRRPIMPRFHAAFSLGTVAGALIGVGCAAVNLPVGIHLSAVAVVTAMSVVCFSRGFLPRTRQEPQLAPGEPDTDGWVGPGGGDGADARDAGASRPRRRSGVLAGWRERRTLLVGLVVLSMALSEGAANDWLGLSLVDGYHVDRALGAVGYGVFATAMTVARMGGPWTLARFGRVRALRGGALLVLAGVLVLVAGGHLRARAGLPAALGLAGLGAFSWGIGSALGFPVGISAASDDPLGAAGRVSVVSTIGYTAFLVGPPLLGRLADHVGILDALLGVGMAVIIAFSCAAAARPAPVSGAQGRTVEE